jgi:hypothetical protein
MRILRIIFALGVLLAVECVSRPCTLLEARPVLLAFSVLFFCTGGFLFVTERNQQVTPKYFAAAFVPWLFAVMLVANGKFDPSPELRHETVVIESRYGRLWKVLVVHSWRDGHTNENLYIERTAIFGGGSARYFHPGEKLTIGVRQGALGMPWINSISPQPEPHPIS